jgi:putative membrane protein
MNFVNCDVISQHLTHFIFNQMPLITRILIAIIIAEHCYFLWLEMFAWTTRGPKVFTHIPAALFKETKTMAANQGLYNGFLAAGLAWTFFIQEAKWQNNVSLFFLSCILIAGLYGAYSVSKRIFFIQALPALIAIVLLLFA